MTITTAIIRLEYYNEWRRGAETPQPNPKELGKLIDFVIKELKKIERSKNNDTNRTNRKGTELP